MNNWRCPKCGEISVFETICSNPNCDYEKSYSQGCMGRLNVDTGYDKIFYCTVCGSSKITKESLDNHTVVDVSCHDCGNEFVITLVDEDEED